MRPFIAWRTGHTGGLRRFLAPQYLIAGPGKAMWIDHSGSGTAAGGCREHGLGILALQSKSYFEEIFYLGSTLARSPNSMETEIE